MDRTRGFVLLVTIATVAAGLLAGCAATAGSRSAPASLGTDSPSTTPQAAAATPGPSPLATASPTPQVLGPDEPWLAYQWLNGQTDSIYLMRPDGTDSHQAFPSLRMALYHPDWSPDGAQLAFEASGESAGDIWVGNADGTDARILVDRNAECRDACGDLAYPAWSPDGSEIAYVRYDFEGDAAVGSAIEIVDVKTGQRRSIYAARSKTLLNYPRWSPDGRFIVYESTTYPVEIPTSGQGTGSSIFVIELTLDGTARPDRLTDPGMWASYPDWHPTGDLIAFTTYDLGEFQGTLEPSNLYTMRPDGSGLTRITTFGKDDTRATQPTWTPDGSQILFTSVRKGGSPRHAAYLDADGSGMTVLDRQYATHPRLRPAP